MTTEPDDGVFVDDDAAAQQARLAKRAGVDGCYVPGCPLPRLPGGHLCAADQAQADAGGTVTGYSARLVGKAGRRSRPEVGVPPPGG